MAFFAPKTSKSESIDKTPYTEYYPHTIDSKFRFWTNPWYQVVSIDPARKNYAFRVERRYFNGVIQTMVFDKVSIFEVTEISDGSRSICNTYKNLSLFLDKYKTFYDECHFIIIERQLPQNYQTTRIAQHTITYFELHCRDKPLLPSIIEVDPKLKGKILGGPKGITDKKELKRWASDYARRLSLYRNDKFAIDIMNHFSPKDDDLADTICQSEALFIHWGISKFIDVKNVNAYSSDLMNTSASVSTSTTLFSFVSLSNIPQRP